MSEHSRIARFFTPLSAGEAGAFSLNDDAALLQPPPGQSLIVTTDSVIEGVHVPKHTLPGQIAQKLVRRNLSDLAAMGATPWRYLLNLHTPPQTPDLWFEAFTAALAREQQHFSMVLAGGDSSADEGPVHATLTCLGLLQGEPLLRSGAQVGDDVYASGTIGDAVLALKLLQQKHEVPEALLQRYFAPEPRLALGSALRGIATACIDISDGLLADAGHIAAASGVGIALERAAIPLSEAAQHYPDWQALLTGGDDYELCFTAPKRMRDAVDKIAETLALPLTRIGTVEEKSGLRLLDEAGKDITPQRLGYSH